MSGWSFSIRNHSFSIGSPSKISTSSVSPSFVLSQQAVGAVPKPQSKTSETTTPSTTTSKMIKKWASISNAHVKNHLICFYKTKSNIGSHRILQTI